MLEILGFMVSVSAAWITMLLVLSIAVIVLILKEAHQYLHRYIPTEDNEKQYRCNDTIRCEHKADEVQDNINHTVKTSINKGYK